jgi:serine/threonine protein kinase
MKKGDKLKGYEIISEVKVGGNCTWAFAKYAGQEYFIKEFLFPVYPLEGSPGSDKTKQNKKKQCEEFERHQRDIIKKVSDCVAAGGNLIIAKDFFREHAKYYKITEKVDISSISIKEIAKLPYESKLLILKTSTHCVRTLHNLNIIHGDLKPDNLLIKEKKDLDGKRSYIGKLIDFDDSYFAQKPPVNNNVCGDLAYYSPELQKYINGDMGVFPSDIDLKSDVFALGIIFCQYLTGYFPEGVTDKRTAASIVNSGKVISIRKHEGIPLELLGLINSMLFYDKEKRPSIKQIFDNLKKYGHDEEAKPIIKPHVESPKVIYDPKVKIKMGKEEKVSSEESIPEKSSLRIYMGKRK